jgi:ATP synthase protein I
MNSDLFSKQVSEKEKRKIDAQLQNKGSVWSGIGMFGMIGWSVAVPTLSGAALGLWLDKRYHQSFSWTLTGLLTGLCTGCVIAWYWVKKENEVMLQPKDKKDE